MYSQPFLLWASLAAVALGQQSLSDVISGNSDLTLLGTYLKALPTLEQNLGQATNITLLAPTNAAITKLVKSAGGSENTPQKTIEALLTYHVLNGTYKADDLSDTPAFVHTLLTDESFAAVTGGQVVEGVKDGDEVTFVSGLLTKSKVTKADIEFSGGVVHIIDTVLQIPQNISSTALATGLTGLVGAVTTADLGTTIDTTPDLTVFAPSNDAFEAIGSALTDISKADLTSILQYHVVKDTVGYSTLLTDGEKIKALDDNELTITIQDDDDIFVNDAKVVTANVIVGNGVVHVIDEVLNPEQTATPSQDADEGAPAFSGASSVSSLGALTSGLPEATTTVAPATTTGGSGGSASTSTSSELGAQMTAAVGAAALFGAGAALLNL